jgi:hypothetical protein
MVHQGYLQAAAETKVSSPLLLIDTALHCHDLLLGETDGLASSAVVMPASRIIRFDRQMIHEKQ